MAQRQSYLRWLERSCLVLAMICVLPLISALAARTYLSAQAANAATTARQVDSDDKVAGRQWGAGGHETSEHPAGQALWSTQRRSAFQRLQTLFTPARVGTLEFPAQRTAIPVFAGDSEVNMTLGAGHLSDTSQLAGNGNIAITSHRDGAFRVLKDVQLGDPVALRVDGKVRRFIVKRRAIVAPHRVDVLEPTSVTTLTLLTCYPFYFVGNAPQRYVLQAELAPPRAAATGSVATQRAPTVRNFHHSTTTR